MTPTRGLPPKRVARWGPLLGGEGCPGDVALPFLRYEILFPAICYRIMPCCIGVRPVIGLSATGTLLPLLFFLTSVVQPCISVCIHCKDTILPAHESANCPLASDIASNVDLFSTGTLGSIPKVGTAVTVS